MDGVVWFLGCVNLVGFFASDLYFAFVLSQLKRDHPSIDDCAPPEVTVFDAEESAGESGYGGMGREGIGRPRSDSNVSNASSSRRSASSSVASSFSAVGPPPRSYQDAPNDPISLVLDAARNKRSGEIASLFTSINPRDLIANATGGVSGNGTYRDVDEERRGGNVLSHEDSVKQQRQRLVHLCVIVASLAAPFFALLQILFPSAMSWSMFHSPTVIGYLATVPALVVVVIYAARAMRIGHFVEVSKAQWLSLAWFRLDVMTIMAVLLLVGWGDWFVAMCLFIVGFYLAFRLLETERRLQQIMQETQLLGGGGGGNSNTIGDHEMVGVVRNAIIAGEEMGVVGAIGAGAGRDYGYNNPEDVFHGRSDMNMGSSSYYGTSAAVAGNYHDVSGGGGANASRLGGGDGSSGYHGNPDFASHNHPMTDSEAEGAHRGGAHAHYSNISGGEFSSSPHDAVSHRGSAPNHRSAPSSHRGSRADVAGSDSDDGDGGEGGSYQNAASASGKKSSSSKRSGSSKKNKRSD